MGDVARSARSWACNKNNQGQLIFFQIEFSTVCQISKLKIETRLGLGVTENWPGPRMPRWGVGGCRGGAPGRCGEVPSLRAGPACRPLAAIWTSELYYMYGPTVPTILLVRTGRR